MGVATKNIGFKNLPMKVFDFDKIIPVMNVTDVFGEINRGYINEFGLFMAHYGSIPNLITEINIK